MKKSLFFNLSAVLAVITFAGCSYLVDQESDDGRLSFGMLVKEPPNTQKLEKLPEITKLISVSRSLAALDLIYQDPFHKNDDASVQFTEHWRDKEGEKVLKLEWEGRDSLVIWFSPGGCVIKGHDDESVMNPSVTPFDLQEQEGKKLYPNLLNGFPKELKNFLKDPDFDSENATFIIWRKADDESWHIGPITWPNRAPNRWKSHDGSDDLLSPLAIDAKAYANWVKKAKHRKVHEQDIEKVFAHEPMSDELLKKLDSHHKLSEIKDKLETIGYPIAK